MATEAEQGDRLAFGDFTIDRGDERLIGLSGPVRLGNKAFRVLLMLAEHEGRLLTKDALFSSVWDGTTVGESALTSVIKELRRALGDEARPPRYIESVYGRGYRFIPPVKRCGPEPATPGRPGAAAAAGGPAKPPLLHVPPFDDAAIRAAHPHLGPTWREEILLALSRFRDIRLVSAEPSASGGSASGWGDRDYQLTLRLLPAGPGYRAFARLSRLGSFAIIWADQADVAPENPGSGIDGLVRKVVAAALPRMQEDLLSNLPSQPKDVYDLYFSTRLRSHAAVTLAAAREIAASWEAMIGDHPDFTLAYPPLTRLYNTDYCFTGIGSTGEAERARAYELAHIAVSIDPTDGHLQTVKGWAHLWQGEPVLAEQHLEEALRLNPYNQRRLVELATGFMYLGQLDRAADLLERCRDLTPFAMDAPHEEEGLLHLLRGEFDQAAAHLALVRRYHPDERAGAKPTITSQFYALLAAAGSEMPDLAARAQAWRRSMEERWCRPEPPTDQRLLEWASFHEPFQDRDMKMWVLGLLERALSSGAEEARPAPRRATGGKAS